MTEKSKPKVIPLKKRKCGMCDKPVVHEFRPFCSRRCANLDLGNWLGETYRVAGDAPPEYDESYNEEE